MKVHIERVKKERSRELTRIHHAIAHQLHKRWIGRIVEALVTGKGKNNTVIARDVTCKNIVIREDLPLGMCCRVKIVGAQPTYLVGTIDE
ncbi:MAG: TRAM domain-containing protein [Methanocellales archaeon]|nr:TRAM domain-containing protein [Methanocellales archaeon]